MRKLFSRLHLWLSIPFGLLISIVCLSGAALVFEQEITRALHPELHRVQMPENDATPLRPSEIATCIRTQMPDSLRLSSLRLTADPQATCTAGFENVKRQTLAADPYTGEVKGWTQTLPFFQTMRRLHRWLMDAPQQKGMPSTGKTVVGVTTLAMTAILLTGLAIWVPRNRRALRSRLSVSCPKGWRRFWYDSHVSLGFYATLLLLVMALTGLTWSFGWYRTAAYALFGGTTTATRPQQQTDGTPAPHRADGKSGHHDARQQTADLPRSRSHGGQATKEAAFDYTVWDRALAAAQERYPHYKSIKLGKGSMEVDPDPSSPLRKTDRLTFDPQTGEVTAIARHEDAPASQTLKGWFYAFHTGSWGGMWTKIPYFLAALIGGLLPLSGYYLWYKKTGARKKNRAAGRP